MGRKRQFDRELAVAAAAELFADEGYEASSMDRLVQATGIHRGSLYGTFGSKRGLFVACLRAASTADVIETDLLLVALMELSWRDAEVHALCTSAIDTLGDDADLTIGRRLLFRAALTAAEPQAMTSRAQEDG